MDKPILFTDRKGNAFCAVSLWDNLYNRVIIRKGNASVNATDICEVISIRHASTYANGSDYQDKFIISLGDKRNGKETSHRRGEEKGGKENH
jgi:hypothetical protein